MKIDTSKLTDVDIYKLILKGELKKFPDQFWINPGAFDSAKEITKYFIEEFLKWDEDQVKENLTELIFRKHKLSGMLEYVFGRSPYKAIENAYPGKYNPWDFRNAYKGIWNNENIREDAIKWLLKKVNKDKFDELTNLDFLNNGLGGLMDYLHKKKLFNDIDKTKVEEGLSFNEREFTITFNKSGGTSSRNGVTTRITLPTSWMKKLGITEGNRIVIAKLEDSRIIIEPKNPIKSFVPQSVEPDLMNLSNIELYKKVLSGEIKRFPLGFWNASNQEALIAAKEITIYLIEEILKWDKKDIKEKLSRDVFTKYKLTGMVGIVFKNRTYDVLKNAYGEDFHPWELKKAPLDFWNNETIKEAIIWLVEKQLNLKPIPQNIRKIEPKVIKDKGLSNLINYIYKHNISLYSTFCIAYPELAQYKEWEVCYVNEWNDSNIKDAVKWLVEEKLSLNPELELSKVRYSDFMENGLKGLISKMGGNVKSTLQFVYNKNE